MVTTRSKTNSLPEKRAVEPDSLAPAPKRKRREPFAKVKPTTKAFVAKKPAPKKSKAEQSSGLVETKSSLTSVARSSGDRTTFLHLPAELRNHIYAYALLQKQPILVNQTLSSLNEPALVAVSHQVRNEALTIWYGENTFLLSGSSPAVRFLRRLPDEKLRFLRTLRIMTDITPTPEYALERIKQLMREFGPRGLPKQAIKFNVTESQDNWSGTADLKRLIKEKAAGAHTSQGATSSNKQHRNRNDPPTADRSRV